MRRNLFTDHSLSDHSLKDGKRCGLRCGARPSAAGTGRGDRSLSVPARVGMACVVVAIATCLFPSGANAVEPAAGPAVQAGVTRAAAPGGLLEALLFYAVAGSTVLSAVGVCLTKNIVRMAVWLLVALASVAMLYFLLAANFLGAIQLIVYAGGTLVLLIFGVMLTSKSPWARFEPRAVEVVLAALVCGSLAATLATVLARVAWPAPAGAVAGAAVADFGRGLMTTYLVPFEVAGVLLMIVMVGAAHLARQEK